MSPSSLPTAAALEHALGGCIDTLITPALVIDLDAVAHNLRATIARVGGAHRWRPHIKTCKQAVIIEAMLEAGVEQFKVATCDELALLLRTAGTRPVDVLLAYPPQRAALEAAVALADAHPSARVLLLADSIEHLEALAAWLGARPSPVSLMLDVDLGMHRTGSPPAHWRALAALPATIHLSGLHGYDGHIRWDQDEAAARGYDELCELAEHLSNRLPAPARAQTLELVTSGTHSYPHALRHRGLARDAWVHRVSPGTIVLSDLRSHQAAADIGLRQAAFVASRVISVGEDRVTLDAGSKGIAPDVAPPNCEVLEQPGLRASTPSEEHLPCAVAGGSARPELGALVWLIPQHVCTTVNLHREAVWIRDGRFAGLGPIAASGHRPRAPVI